MENALVIDIETWPETDEVIDRFATVQVPDRIPFDPDSVKVGNMKDEQKIRDKIEAARERHEEEQDELCDPDLAKEKARERVLEKACLKGHLSRIYAWGAMDAEFVREIRQVPDPSRDQEKVLVKELVELIAEHLTSSGRKVVGWNTEGFDIPVILQRAMILGVFIPFDVRMPLYYNDWSVDLMRQWTWSNSSGIKLNDVAKALGVDGKVPLDGKLPWEMCVESPKRSREYLEQDIEMTWEIGCIMNNSVRM